MQMAFRTHLELADRIIQFYERRYLPEEHLTQKKFAKQWKELILAKQEVQTEEVRLFIQSVIEFPHPGFDEYGWSDAKHFILRWAKQEYDIHVEKNQG